MCHSGASGIAWAAVALTATTLLGCGGSVGDDAATGGRDAPNDTSGGNPAEAAPERSTLGAGGATTVELASGSGAGEAAATDLASNAGTAPETWAPWARSLEARADAVATDTEGNLVVVTRAPAAQSLWNEHVGDLTVSLLDPGGAELWSAAYPRTCDSPLDVVVTRDNQIWLACVYTVDMYMETTLGLTGEVDTYRSLYLISTSRDGERIVWSIDLDGGARPALAADAEGSLFVNGSDFLFAKRSVTGSALWEVPTPAEDVLVDDLAVAASGDVLVTGTLDGEVGLDGNALDADLTEGRKRFVARYDSGGQHLWSEVWPASTAGHLAAAPDGAFVVCARFDTPFELDDHTLEPRGSLSSLVVGFDAAGGYRFVRSLPFSCNGVDVTSDDSVVLTGDLGGAVDLGGGEVGANDRSAVAYVKLDADGEHLASAAFVGSDDTYGQAIAAHPGGGVVLVGGATGAVDFGIEQLQPATGFVARLEVAAD